MTPGSPTVALDRPEAERTLIDGLRRADPAALEALMERYAARIFRLAYGITRNEADAEEVVQDVFLSVFRKIGGFEGRAWLWTWMYRIAASTALLRRRGKRKESEVPLEECLPRFLEDGHREGDRAMLLCDWSATPEEALLTGETRDLVWRALDRLPDHHRLVLLLRDLEGLSNEEVAEVTAESVACVKSRLHRARMALREALTRALGPSRAA
jgi:RNA polymerase sigma-70 factor (ECF subfamily)